MMTFDHVIKKYTKPSKKGFSLVEMMAVIAILAICSTAILSVYLMVGDVTRDAGKITVEQLNVGQTEKFIRHELSVASSVNVVKPDYYHEEGLGTKLNDEYIMFDIVDDPDDERYEQTGRVRFYRYDEHSEKQNVLTISDVQSVEFSIVPVNEKDPAVGQHYKFFYTISTSKYNYTGGFILSNTEIGSSSDKSMVYGDVYADSARNVRWEAGSNDNEYAIYFHREVSVISSIEESTGSGTTENP